MASSCSILKTVGLMFLLLSSSIEASWCVARSDASKDALQTALDYACGAGADCAPIQPNGLCYLPNSVEAHASYAFNSYYQRRGNAQDSCYFASTANMARTDPSYGSCVYPASPSSAGGTVGQGGTTVGTITPGTGVTPTLTMPPPPGAGSTPLLGNQGGLNPGMGSVLPDTPPSASPNMAVETAVSGVVFAFFFLFIYETM